MSSWYSNAFNGGMNEVLDGALLEKTQGKLMRDCVIESGKIEGVSGLMVMDGISSPEELKHYGNSSRSWVKWYGRYYWSDNVNGGYSGNEEDLGVPYPGNPAPIAKEPEGSESGLTGKYKYCWTYVNENGWEGAPCAEGLTMWTEIELEDKVCEIRSGQFPEGIAYMKLYRTTNNGADFYCVGRITCPGGKFLDAVDDNTLVMLENASSFDNYPPPAGGKYLTESGGVFFLGVGSELHYSVQGNPHAWPTLNYIGFDDVITGIVQEFQGILVFTRNKVYRVTGAESSETITKQQIPGEQGCKDWKSIARLNNAPVWVSNDGICLWDGESLSVVSLNIMDLKRSEITRGVSGDERYYLYCTDRCVVYDRRAGGVFYELSLTCDYAWYDADADRIYLQKGNVIYAYGQGERMLYEYITPDIGDKLSWKKFSEIIVSSTGNCMITGYADGKEKFTKNIRKSGKTRFRWPYGESYRSVSLRIYGKGRLEEIAVSWS